MIENCILLLNENVYRLQLFYASLSIAVLYDTKSYCTYYTLLPIPIILFILIRPLTEVKHFLLIHITSSDNYINAQKKKNGIKECYQYV